jgi:hypothetical protein
MKPIEGKPLVVAPALAQADDRPPEPAKIHTLGEMSEECVFFTPALLVTHGRLDRDPMREFNALLPASVPEAAPFAVDSSGAPFFTGLGETAFDGETIRWDYRLYGICRERWPECLRYLGSVAMYDTKCYHYARAVHYELRIVDSTALGQLRMLRDLPILAITVFGVSTNRNLVYLAPAVDPPRTLPHVALREPDEAIVREAEAVLGPPPDPQALADRIYPNKDIV